MITGNELYDGEPNVDPGGIFDDIISIVGATSGFFQTNPRFRREVNAVGPGKKRISVYLGLSLA